MPTVADHVPFATLLPPTGWAMMPDLFNQETERNEGSFAPASIAWPGFNSQIVDQLPATGVVSRIRFLLEGGVTTTLPSGAIVLTDAWPHGLISRFILRINGQSTPWNCRGQDLDVLRKLRYRSIPDNAQVSAVTVGTPGTYPLRVIWDVPLSLDPAIAPSGGGLFAQSVNSQILSEITTAPVADVATLTGAATFVLTNAAGTGTAQFRRLLTWFAIPTGKLSDNSTGMILPDLSVMHGLLSQEQSPIVVGDNIVELNRVQGTIARLWQRYKNGTTAPTTLLPANFTQFQFRYATNQQPRVLYPYHLMTQADDWYRGQPPYGAQVLFDALAENLARDALDVEGLANPQVVGTVATGTSVDPNARIVTVYEILAPLA